MSLCRANLPSTVHGTYYPIQLTCTRPTAARLAAQVTYDDSVDIDGSMIDGGGGLTATLFPRDPKNGCKPVYPHSFLKVNTIFEVRAAEPWHVPWFNSCFILLHSSEACFGPNHVVFRQRAFARWRPGAGAD